MAKNKLPSPAASGVNFEQAIEGIYESLEISFFSPLEKHRTIGFVAPHPKDGNTTAVIAAGYYLSKHLNAPTLIIDGNSLNHGLSRIYGLADQPGFSDPIKADLDAIESIIYKPSAPFDILPYGLNQCEASIDDRRRHLQDLLNYLESRYTYVLFDSCALSALPASLVYLTIFQGVILTIKCEDTKWETAQHLKRAVMDAGGNTIGVILNQMKNYIPKSLNNWV